MARCRHARRLSDRVGPPGLARPAARGRSDRHGDQHAEAGDSPAWQGSKEAEPSAYPWLSGLMPADTYGVTVLRGVRPKQVLRRLGTVEKDLGLRTWRQASGFAFHRMHADYSMPTVVQVTRLGHAVVAYEPVSDRAFFHAHRMTPHALMASFITDVDLDTYLKVARHGSLVRKFDPLLTPPRRGALPEERGLHFGARHGNVFKRSWAFLERITLTHITRHWFGRPHPTYVLRGRS
ncbi:MAG TPA: hypothetical protein VHR35_05450 [Nocardioides sp.]|nr:hypothetical protein [Nocardioides sp.]